MEGHAKKCVERYCELANKTTQQLYKVCTTCIDDHHFKEEEMKSVGELSQVCSQIVLKCFSWHGLEGPDILWSVNKLARSITKWTKACDKRLNRLYLTLITHVNTNSIVMWVILPRNAGWDCFKVPILQEILSPLLEEHHAFFGSHTFVPISWMCKKQTSVSHSSTESEIISLDAGLRLDGIPALDLWDLIVLVLGNTTQNHESTGQPVVGSNTTHVPSQQSRGIFKVLNNVDRVPSNVQSSYQEALLYVFEDNRAVIKMIIKGRSPQ